MDATFLVTSIVRINFMTQKRRTLVYQRSIKSLFTLVDSFKEITLDLRELSSVVFGRMTQETFLCNKFRS